MIQTILFLTIILCSSQRNLECDVYINGDNEVIVVDENRISYRLKNKGGIITYSYFSGEYNKRKNKYKLGLDKGEYAEIRSTADVSSHEEVTKVCFYHRNSEPLQYASIVFKSNENIIQEEYYIEDSGCINVLNSSLVDSFDTQFEMQLLGNTYAQSLQIKKGEEYQVHLKVPTKYGIQNDIGYKRKFLKIESMGQDQVRVYDSTLKKWKVFEKISEFGNCHDFIFNE